MEEKQKKKDEKKRIKKMEKQQEKMKSKSQPVKKNKKCNLLFTSLRCNCNLRVSYLFTQNS